MKKLKTSIESYTLFSDYTESNSEINIDLEKATDERAIRNYATKSFANSNMPSKTIIDPPAPIKNVNRAGTFRSLLYSGSKFHGSQKSKGSCYEVEVILQVTNSLRKVQ